ncbi:hypothetical protein ACHOLT_09175 [Desulfitobacterium sp. Sab5]|uniref:hypothetical protein n=1 Tax=Desulfitobacterium nosdiversum TaxID=3375356 RepID=UPI003CF3E293
MKWNIWNPNITVKERWIMMFIGAILTITCFVLYRNYFYIEGYADKYLNLTAYVVFLGLGIELIILTFNLRNNKIRYILAFLSGALLIETIHSDLFRVGGILFIIAISFFFIAMLIKNIISTFMTFSISIMPFALGSVLLMTKSNLNDYVIAYLSIIVFLLFYKLFGVKMNRFFIEKFMGFKDEALMYDEVQLKAQLNFVYIIIFIVLNVNNMFNGNNAVYGNLLNNSFLTSLAMIQLNWKKIFWLLDKNNKKI